MTDDNGENKSTIDNIDMQSPWPYIKGKPYYSANLKDSNLFSAPYTMKDQKKFKLEFFTRKLKLVELVDNIALLSDLTLCASERVVLR